MLSWLAAASVAATAAILLVLLLRWPLRKLFGASLAYQSWLIVPASIVATLLPRPEVPQKMAVVALVQTSAGAVAAAVEPAPDWTGPLAAGWLCGAAAVAFIFWRAHASFVRGLGRLVPDGGLYLSGSCVTGPALLGLWRPKIVVPADFATRYSAQEQALVVEHERVHARRGDIAVNLVQAGLQCAFWFNPLVHAAALRFRADQEMACDAAVLRRHPGLVKTYAQALLKSQTFSTVAPPSVACAWRLHHPVKERFMTLQQNHPGARRRFVGRFLVASLVAGAGYAALAARADEAAGQHKYDVQFSWQESESGKVTLIADEFLRRRDERTPHIIVRPGATFTLWEGTRWKADFVITPVSAADRTYKLAAKVSDGVQTWNPALIGRYGENTGIAVGSGGKKLELALVVNQTEGPQQQR
jgi:beta-lactamase regulating signal transducer with metallopeptidase domain